MTSILLDFRAVSLHPRDVAEQHPPALKLLSIQSHTPGVKQQTCAEAGGAVEGIQHTSAGTHMSLQTPSHEALLFLGVCPHGSSILSVHGLRTEVTRPQLP